MNKLYIYKYLFVKHTNGSKLIILNRSSSQKSYIRIIESTLE